MTQNNNPTADIPLQPLPGLQSFKKCDNFPEEYGYLNELAVQMLIVASEFKVFELPKGSRQSGAKWNELMLTLFTGRKNADGKRDGNGVLRGFEVWTTKDAATAKLKPLLKGIVEHFGSPLYRMFAGKGPDKSVLETLSEQMIDKMEAAERKKDEKANEKAARRIQNETVEGELGFRAPGNGVEGPSLLREVDSHDADALALLAQPTGSVSKGQGGSSAVAAAAAAAAIASTFTTPRVEASRNNTVQSTIATLAGTSSRSNALDSAVASLAAGKVATVTKKGTLSAIKNARNLDHVDLTDGLESSLDRTSTNVLEAFTAFTGSPNSKRQKTNREALLNIQERMNLLLKEIKDLKEMNDPAYDDDIKEAQAQFRLLREERKRLSEAVVEKGPPRDLSTEFMKRLSEAVAEQGPPIDLSREN
ncbi:hypothetical protein ACHAWT_002904 [Skeletonema menzelii]